LIEQNWLAENEFLEAVGEFTHPLHHTAVPDVQPNNDLSQSAPSPD
jgi:hypothetical protein